MLNPDSASHPLVPFAETLKQPMKQVQAMVRGDRKGLFQKSL